MIEGGINNLYHLITLGGRAQEEVWNEAKVFMNIPAAI